MVPRCQIHSQKHLFSFLWWLFQLQKMAASSLLPKMNQNTSDDALKIVALTYAMVKKNSYSYKSEQCLVVNQYV